MFMALAASFGMKALGGILGGLGARKQAKYQNQATYLQNQRMLMQAGQQASQAYTQMGSLASQATGTLAEAHRQAQLQSGQQQTLAAASGTIGASVDAVQNDIQRQDEVQRAQLATDLDTQLFNLRSQANAAYSDATNNLGTAVKAPSTGSIIGNSLLNAGLSTGAEYLGARMQFGAGKSNRVAPSTPKTMYTPATTYPLRSSALGDVLKTKL